MTPPLALVDIISAGEEEIFIQDSRDNPSSKKRILSLLFLTLSFSQRRTFEEKLRMNRKKNARNLKGNMELLGSIALRSAPRRATGWQSQAATNKSFQKQQEQDEEGLSSGRLLISEVNSLISNLRNVLIVRIITLYFEIFTVPSETKLSIRYGLSIRPIGRCNGGMLSSVMKRKSPSEIFGS